MKEFDSDLHYHSPYSVGVSKNMLIPIISEQAKLKGLDFLSSADCLNGPWLKHLKENLVEEENKRLKSETASYVGLSKLVLIASDKGFIKNPPIINLSGRVSVALNPR